MTRRAFFLIGGLSLLIAAGNRWEEEGRAWWKNVEYLASDDTQGRLVGSSGFEIAANYVAEQFERTGLKTTGENSYFQKVPLKQSALLSAKMHLSRRNHATEVYLPEEAVIHFSAHSAPNIKAHVVFAGYGLQIPEAGYDDLKDLPVRGSIVAYLAGQGPANIPTKLKAHYMSTGVRWKALQAAGAVGMVGIQNPNRMDVSWEQQTVRWDTPKVSLVGGDANDGDELPFSVLWNPWRADDLLAGSGHRFAEILAAADKMAPLPHFELARDLKAEVSVETRTLDSKNVVAIHPGTDPLLKDEYVVISAHLDHLGVRKAGHGDHVYNGAMDDASGVASVIEIAKMMRNVETKRSLLFLSFTAEEEGELGSTYFIRHFPLSGRLVADLNMDMFLPLYPLKSLQVQGLEESTLGQEMEKVAYGSGVRVQPDNEPEKLRFARSDQYSFVKAGVPSLAFKFGYEKGEPEERIFKYWYASRYHTVHDNISQPVDLKAAARFNDILKEMLLRIANADEAPKWRDDSFFKRFAAAGM